METSVEQQPCSVTCCEGGLKSFQLVHQKHVLTCGSHGWTGKEAAALSTDKRRALKGECPPSHTRIQEGRGQAMLANRHALLQWSWRGAGGLCVGCGSQRITLRFNTQTLSLCICPYVWPLNATPLTVELQLKWDKGREKVKTANRLHHGTPVTEDETLSLLDNNPFRLETYSSRPLRCFCGKDPPSTCLMQLP